MNGTYESKASKRPNFLFILADDLVSSLFGHRGTYLTMHDIRASQT